MSQKFNVLGSNRIAGALGLPEYFLEAVEAESSQEAEDMVRKARYRKGFENVHVLRIWGPK